MGISDDALAQTYLNRIGYYRLSGYWYPFRESTGAGAEVAVGDNFRPGTKFSEVVELYVFDKKLRLLMLDVIERIEIAFRVQITLELGKLGPHAHRDATARSILIFNAHPGPAQRKATTKNGCAYTMKHLRALKRITRSTADSDDLARVYRFDLAQDSEMISPTIPS
jgi:abortive infection bacteriophage resistance protein